MSEKKLLRKMFDNYEDDDVQTEYENALMVEKKRNDYLKRVEKVVKSIDGKENERN